MNSTVAMDCIEDNPSQSGIAGSVIPSPWMTTQSVSLRLKSAKGLNTTDKLYLTLLLK